MVTLSKDLRRILESTVKEARRVAEEGARKAIESLAVHHHEPWTGLSPEQRTLRNRLRAHGRQVGDKRDERRGTQTIDRLVTECAYEHWHRMLFARFLAENNLLIEPSTGVAITLQECQELARERSEDWLEMASGFAEGMLPQIFRQDDPVLDVTLPAETRSRLEDMLKALPSDVFLADDSLGWVYQFWQAERKDEVNRSERKIGADELPAVTQLFTEDYMVLFLLHNTLGAWWAGKVLAAKPELARSARSEDELRTACAVGSIEWTYLRFVREGEDGPWKPAAGTFDGWPKEAKDITLLDPCMGSGHFLVFALPILVAFRMAEEGLSEEAAIEAVLRDNLFGLEIDLRCTQIAAFNLALAAWRRVGYRYLPSMHLACSGLGVAVRKEDWISLAPKSDRMQAGMERLYHLFQNAPVLGSLINPRILKGNLLTAEFRDLQPLMGQALKMEITDEIHELAVTAKGIAEAAEILAMQFTLVATNYPFLLAGKQESVLKQFTEDHYPAAKNELATCFLSRSLELMQTAGTQAVVISHAWLFMTTYEQLRRKLLEETSFQILTRLGARAFETISGEVVQVALLVVTKRKPTLSTMITELDAGDLKDADAKNLCTMNGALTVENQFDILKNPEARFTLGKKVSANLLGKWADSYIGLQTSDNPRFLQQFWEGRVDGKEWRYFQAPVNERTLYGGREARLRWDNGHGDLSVVGQIKGTAAWGKNGVAVRLMSDLPPTLYNGDIFEQSSAVLVPKNPAHLLPIWTYCLSADFATNVRVIDKALKITNKTFEKISFSLDYWKNVAAKKYPQGLPKPFSSDPTQWIFIGHPKGSDQPLQVAVARLLGYQWPRQTGSSFMDCPALGPDGLERHSDTDGIVCLTPLRGEAPADQRLIALLADAFGAEWSAGKLSSLLADVGFEGKTLDDWLRDGFFEQHCDFFHHRPFIWHIWDGRRDGFHALVNYHKLAAPDGEGKRTLETLIYTYIGDWIDRQRADQKAGVEGADGRVAAAEYLKTELEKILVGEPPYDIFVRWKPLHEQAIGWEPDINDSVRLNIRPFMTAKPLAVRARGACILRSTPKIKWEKDRGKEPHRSKEEFPWFWSWDGQTQDFTGGKDPDGNRWNDLHYTNAFKQAALARRA